MLSKRVAALTAALPFFFILTGAAKVELVSALKDGHDPGACLSVEEVTYAPGRGAKPHHHDATIVAYVLKGAIASKVGNEPLRTYRPGQHWIELPGAAHLVSRNASRNEPATFLAVLLAHRGTEEAQSCGG